MFNKLSFNTYLYRIMDFKHNIKHELAGRIRLGTCVKCTFAETRLRILFCKI